MKSVQQYQIIHWNIKTQLLLKLYAERKLNIASGFYFPWSNTIAKT